VSQATHHGTAHIDKGYQSILSTARGTAEIVSHPHLDGIEVRFDNGNCVMLTPQAWRNIIHLITTALDTHWSDDAVVTA